MKIVKASAGSGKTHLLSGTYMDLLLDSEERHPYRNILAVTFTNKATAEMKARILRDLDAKAAKDERARKILIELLHDYSAFSVSTIDRFFQQTLKAFSREIGQFAAYQVELDKNSLVTEAMDRILEGLTEEDRDLIEWLSAEMSDRLEQGQKFDMDKSLYEIGMRLKSEEHRQLCDTYGIDESKSLSKDTLGSLKKVCAEAVSSFEKQAARFGMVAEPGKKMAMPGARKLKADPELASFIEGNYDRYSTAYTIGKLMFDMGLAEEFYREFDGLLREKNVLPLDDSNSILRDIIDGSDAPFIYEKTGVRYRHFLLDEFQDTSNIQWANFLPLLRESQSQGGRSLVVGDVKQSIYRWRNSDWRLLGHEMEKAFPEAQKDSLRCNWRSAGNIVRFNNGFFSFAADRTGTSDIYSDVEQEVQSKDLQQGSVQVSFTDDQIGKTIDSILRARDAGADWSDIAVLVRGHNEGGIVTAALVEAGIPVISDDSLSLKSSLTVRRTVSLLSVMDNPEDTVGGYLAESLGIVYPESHHSLTDLCEGLLRQLRQVSPDTFDGETLFIQAFMDDMQKWVESSSNNLLHYLKHWEESEIYISSPQNSSSVRVLTIHKSKGLEFPYVIFPFAEKVTLFKPETHWCHLDAAAAGLGPEAEGIFPVCLSSSSEHTAFAEDYRIERNLQAVDNINVFYVALTRAKQGLHVIAAVPTKTIRDDFKANGRNARKFSKFSDLLYIYGNGLDDFTIGTMYDFNLLKRDDNGDVRNFDAGYPSYAIDGRLGASDEAFDFFGDDGETGTQASARLEGIRLHSILSKALRAGDIREEDGEPGLCMLAQRVRSHPEWFPEDGSGICRNEVTIIGTDGRLHRPDRVMISDGRVTVIDYKFGARDQSHDRQVRRYMDLYRRMGYGEVEGFVWYVPEDHVIPVQNAE